MRPVKRTILFLLAALVPVAVLSTLYPDRLIRGGAGGGGDYSRNPDAAIIAFIRQGCPHCRDFRAFADENGWTVDYRDIAEPGAQETFRALQRKAPDLSQAVPTFVIGGHILQGYDDADGAGAKLQALHDSCRALEDGCLLLDPFLASEGTTDVITAQGTCTGDCEIDTDRYVLDVWLVGEVDLTLLSLPALSVLLGFIDGFNPCAMWVLVTLLTLLINTHDMRKVWVVGGTFLFVSGAIYYLFIAAWLNVFLLIGLNAIVQKIIGIVAVLGGGFYLYEAIGKNPDECKVTNLTRRQRTIAKMKNVLHTAQWPAMIVSVAILAVSVNTIELVCTAGLPAVFTQILAFNDVSAAARYALIGLYILLYMIDDLVIFAIAVTALHATGLTKKYSRFTLISGGILMYALGLLLLFAPEVLAF